MGEPKQSVATNEAHVGRADAVAQKTREGIGRHKHAGDMTKMQRFVAIGHARRDYGPFGPGRALLLSGRGGHRFPSPSSRRQGSRRTHRLMTLGRGASTDRTLRARAPRSYTPTCSQARRPWQRRLLRAHLVGQPVLHSVDAGERESPLPEREPPRRPYRAPLQQSARRSRLSDRPWPGSRRAPPR